MELVPARSNFTGIATTIHVLPVSGVPLVFTKVEDKKLDTVRRPLKEAFLASKIVILDYFSRELPF